MSFSIQSTLSRVMRFKTVVNLAVGFQLLFAPVSVYAQENVSAAAALPYCASDTSIILRAGSEDNFVAKLLDDPAAAPSAALKAYIQQTSTTGSSQNYLAGFDETVDDHFMAHTFNFPEYKGLISKARFTTSLKPNPKPKGALGYSDTDKIGLRFSGGTNSSWERFIGHGNSVGGNPVSGLRSNVWDLDNYPNGSTFREGLESLPLPNGTANLASDMNANGFLDFYVQDDTSVDYVDLELCIQKRDLGDAPDSTNHSNFPMSAYPGIVAQFPSVYDGQSVPGPIHWDAKAAAWLGPNVSGEYDADLLSDADTNGTNIAPNNNLANQDQYDDGVDFSTVVLGECVETRFKYTVSRNLANASSNYFVNVWFDFNRDGNWDDVPVCQKSNGQWIKISEWAVKNQAITANTPYATFYTPSFATLSAPTQQKPMWMRVMISEKGAAQPSSTALADGRGPMEGYRYGETEDYLLDGSPIKLPLAGVKAADTEVFSEAFSIVNEGSVDSLNYEEISGPEAMSEEIDNQAQDHPSESIEEVSEEETMRNHLYMPIVNN